MAKLYRKIGRAFTLIEIVVVLAVMSLLLVLAAPSLSSAVQASRLTTAGENLLFKISLAQQISVTENRSVELRWFYYTEEGIAGCHAFQLFYYDDAGDEGTPLENPTYFGTGSVVVADGALSPLLDATGTGKAATAEPFQSRSATYKSIVFHANGSTNITLPLRSSYLTLVGARATLAAGGVPPNYYTLQIDPVTGKARSYRP